jgi:hypothetical protein
MQQSHSNPNKNTAIVLYEDRPSYEIGMQLLVLSLEEHWSDVDVHIFAPNATENFQQWISHRPVSLHLECPTEAKGVNVKPYVLLWALDKGYTQAIWMDSDMILSRPLSKIFLEQPDDILIASELPGLRKINIHDRTKPWGLETGRSFKRNPSSCCIWGTQAHRSLIEDWKRLIESHEYQHWQAFSVQERPIHASHEDAVFMALIGSKQYENLSIKLLKCGQDIAQCLTISSYSLNDRLKAFFSGPPPIIHAMGKKPWLAEGTEKFEQSISPYACVARRYQKYLEVDTDWLEVSKNWQQIWCFLVKNSPSFTSFPLLIKEYAVTWLMKVLKKIQGS